MVTAATENQELMSSETDAPLITIGGGIALIVLGILSLAKIDPTLLNSIAAIAGGIIALVESGRLPAQYVRVLAKHQGHGVNPAEVSSGMNAGVMAGGGGIVLGILAIIGRASDVLDAIAVITLGGALLFYFVAHTQIRALQMSSDAGGSQSVKIALAVSSSTNTAVVMVAVALIALGILALAGIVPVVLIAIALLSLGTYLFLSGTAVTSRLFEMIPY